VRKIVVKEGSSHNPLSEEKIAHQLGVSRTPIREVLSHLEEEGLLERRHKKGITLKEPSLKELIEIYDLRAVLEGLAARLLAAEIDEKTIDELKGLCQNLKRITESKNVTLSEVEKVDLAFHQKIVEKCGNNRLRKVINNFHLITLSFRLTQKKEFKKRKFHFPHEEILKALENKGPDKAELAIRLHIQEGKESFIKEILGPTALLVKQKNGH
ncbi:MAG: GntR family transcriptional regulator, partial [Candidatus Omnitrophica bacterium]|nr:GntR family transcriptional regulator [Candidatus Omnitrophota bacterium]